MSVVSYSFFLFLFIVLILYYIVPKKMQWIILLIGSLAFYAFSGIAGLLIVVGSALVVYILSLFMQKNLERQDVLTANEDRRGAIKIKNRMKGERKKYLVLGLVLVIFLMVLFKASDFILQNINVALKSFNVRTFSSFNLIVPLGISYYSFMMISYLMELYTGKTRAQKNFLKYLTYVLYFPHITQGPIARFEESGEEIIKPHDFDFNKVSSGILLMLWGYFKKMVIADRMAPFVNGILDNSGQYKGSIFLIMGMAYSMQIYCDFSGCMDVIRGTSECFGITLKENFRRPYFSKTMPEFWRRWHISLGEFFREYVFYPVSTSKLALKISSSARKLFGNDGGRNISSCLPIMCVWVLTGIWHGANWNYIGWGVYHGILICLSTVFTPIFEPLTKKYNIFSSFFWKLFQMARTFFLCLIGRIIFLGNGVADSFSMLKSSFADFSYIEMQAFESLHHKEWVVLFCGCLLVGCVSILQEYKQNVQPEYTVRSFVMKRNIVIKSLLAIVAVMAILCLGKYGLGVGASFIYEQF